MQRNPGQFIKVEYPTALVQHIIENKINDLYDKN